MKKTLLKIPFLILCSLPLLVHASNNKAVMTTNLFEKTPDILIENQLVKTTSIITLILLLIIIILLALWKKGILQKIVTPNIDRKYIIGMFVFFLILFAASAIFPASSVVFNTDELITRYTGKEYKADATSMTEWNHRKRKGRTQRPRTYYTFHTYGSETDSLYRVISANKTTFDTKEGDPLDNVTICLDEKNSKMAVLLPRHTEDNIFYITLNTIILLILVILTICGYSHLFKTLEEDNKTSIK